MKSWTIKSSTLFKGVVSDHGKNKIVKSFSFRENVSRNMVKNVNSYLWTYDYGPMRDVSDVFIVLFSQCSKFFLSHCPPTPTPPPHIYIPL
jgi:hypothetical protein